MLAIDSETCLIAPGLLAPPLVCVSTSGGASAHLVSWREAEELIDGLLYRGTESIVGHNIAYDMAVLGAQFPRMLPLIFEAYDADQITDTGVRQKLLDIAGGVYRGFVRTDGKVEKLNYHLADLVKRHLGRELPKEGTWRLRYGELRDVPIAAWPEDARRYALDDARATFDVWQAQQPNEAEWLKDQYRQTRYAFWRHLMSAWGLRTDPQAVAELEKTKRSEYDRLARELVAAGLKRANKTNKKGAHVEGARDTKAAAAAVSRALGGAAPRTKKGAVKLDEETCKAAGLEAYGAFASVKKSLSTDIPLVKQGIIQARFDTASSGRTTSRPNVQNLPTTPGLRECFVPEPGFVIAAADYSGFELCSGAQVCLDTVGHSRLAEDMRAGRDPHTTVGAGILGVPYAEALARYKAGDHAAYLARQTGKVANFGLPGGLGIDALMAFAKGNYGVVLTRDQASEIKGTWLASYPEWADYFRWAGKIANLAFPQVEQLRSGRFRGGVSYTELCNTMFQGLAADAAQSAGWLIAKACYVDGGSPLLGSRVIDFVHDEFLLSVPEATAHECALELGRLMELGAAPWMPDVPPKAEPLLMRRWSKKAKPVYENGRLVPWE
jgi:hypothetical protein